MPPCGQPPDTRNLYGLSHKARYNTSAAQHGSDLSVKKRQNSMSVQRCGYCFNQGAVKSLFDIKK